MPTRPSGTSTRSKKSPSPNLPPVTTVTNEEHTHTDPEAVDNRAADGVVGESASSAEITNTNLEHREIPSFSTDRALRIAEAAYWRAERRGFAPGHELDDWLHAEREVDSRHSK